MIVFLLGLLAVSYAQETHTGDVREYLNSLRLPGARSESFVIASEERMELWREAVNAALRNDWLKAAELAPGVNYRLIEFTDPDRGTYYVLRERAEDAQGQGTYVFRPEHCRPIVFQAPHAGGDTNTLPQSIHLFLELNAYGLFIAGTHRCSNAEPSNCDGRSSFCTGRDAAYPVSDVAHFTRNFFHPAHEQLMRNREEQMVVQLHGFAWEDGDPDLMISNATCRDREQSRANELAARYLEIFRDLDLPLGAGSCNERGGPDRLCAQSNVQARFTAGSANPCACAGGRGTCVAGSTCEQSMPYPERFLHIEQSCAMREMRGCERPARAPYDVTVEVFRRMFPCESKVADGR
ncbi:MAG: hypothetical protein JNL98_03190 [Bryobacterales bacterium]|nr:hypothetical protein [Bryobacterales bacterium]